MFAITLVFTSVVYGVKLASEDRIERNQQVKLQKVILKVLGIGAPDEMTDQETEAFFSERVQPITVDDKTVYVGRASKGGATVGYAFPVGGPGFWGPIQGMVAVNPDASQVLGVAFYKQNETPGLGGRITEKWFQKQFEGLPLHPVTGDEKIFYLKPEGAAQGPDELDAITGATNTSRAVETFLNRDLERFLEDLWPEVKQKG
jgi:Na+-transporting NADH:ubiquinone oxidoreductase subunit C